MHEWVIVGDRGLSHMHHFSMKVQVTVTDDPITIVNLGQWP